MARLVHYCWHHRKCQWAIFHRYQISSPVCCSLLEPTSINYRNQKSILFHSSVGRCCTDSIWVAIGTTNPGFLSTASVKCHHTSSIFVTFSTPLKTSQSNKNVNRFSSVWHSAVGKYAQDLLGPRSLRTVRLSQNHEWISGHLRNAWRDHLEKCRAFLEYHLIAAAFNESLVPLHNLIRRWVGSSTCNSWWSSSRLIAEMQRTKWSRLTWSSTAKKCGTWGFRLFSCHFVSVIKKCCWLQVIKANPHREKIVYWKLDVYQEAIRLRDQFVMQMLKQQRLNFYWRRTRFWVHSTIN